MMQLRGKRDNRSRASGTDSTGSGASARTNPDPLLPLHHAGKAGTAAGRLAMLANTVRGLSQLNLRRLYLACVVPIMTYGAPVWWPNKTGRDGKLAGKKQHEKDMEKVQRRALRIICAAFRTTPTAALELEASIPPVRHTLNQAVRAAGIRFNKLSGASPVVERLPDSWRSGNAPHTPPPLPPQKPRSRAAAELRKTTPLLHAAASTSPDDERIDPFAAAPWRRAAAEYNGRFTIANKKPTVKKDEAAKAHKARLPSLTNPATIIAYTDGSQKDDRGTTRVGAGVVLYHNGTRVRALRAGLGQRAEVYDAEMAALQIAAAAATTYAEQHREVKSIVFFADNSAAVSTIHDPKPRAGQYLSALFHKAMCAFLDECPERTVEVAWCPGHRDVAGNEEADKLAKAAVTLPQNGGPTQTRAHAMRKSKETTLAEWTKEWRATARTGRFAVANRIPPSLRPTQHFVALQNEREVFGRVVQCRTGHCFQGAYYKTFVPSEDVDCPCGERLQTREHSLRECPRYDAFRGKLRDASRNIILSEILGTPRGIEALSGFLRRSGAFTKTGEPRAPRAAPVPELEPEDYGGWEVEGGEDEEEWR